MEKTVPKKGWYQRYQEIKPTLDAHTGKDSINLLIQELAPSQGYEAKALNRMIRAGRFLDSLVGPLEAETVRGGYAHIELLRRLHELNSEAARPYIQKAITKQIKLHQLQSIIDLQVEQAGNPAELKRSKARARTFDHERNTAHALQKSGPGFFGSPEGTFVKVEQSDLLNQFFLLLENSLPKVAIFARLGDSSRKEVKAAAELIRLANTARLYFDSVWIIFPAESKLVHEVAFLAAEQEAFRQWLHLATLSPEEEVEEEGAIAEVRILYTAYSRLLLDYANPQKWVGRTLGDGSPKTLRGSLVRKAWTMSVGTHADNQPILKMDMSRTSWVENIQPIPQTETCLINNKEPVPFCKPKISSRDHLTPDQE
jgi:hypothetical protein